jgi:hypothetical protein
MIEPVMIGTVWDPGISHQNFHNFSSFSFPGHRSPYALHQHFPYMTVPFMKPEKLTTDFRKRVEVAVTVHWWPNASLGSEEREGNGEKVQATWSVDCAWTKSLVRVM